MHNAVAVLVRAPDKKSAKEEALAVFEQVKRHGHSYDGFRIENVYLYDSEKGKSALQTVFGYQTLGFNDFMAEIRKRLTEGPANSDEELIADHQFRFACWCVGDTDGWNMRVFDADGEGVQDNAHLKDIIEDWPSLVESGKHKKSKDPLWVVTADGHH